MAEMTNLARRIMRHVMAELHVMIPGEIIRYDHTQQRADVHIGVRRPYLDGLDEDAPIITDVPVIFPRSGGASITFPVLPGDTVMIAFADRDIDAWVQHGANEMPADVRMHTTIDAVAIPGLIPFSTGSMSENNTDVLLTYQGTNIRIKEQGNVEIEAPHVLIDAPTVHMTGNLQVDGDTTVLGDEVVWGQTYTLGVLNLSFHVHPGVESGTSVTGIPVSS